MPKMVDPLAALLRYETSVCVHFDTRVAWKSGFPHMATLRTHFRSILYEGYDASREVVLVRLNARSDRVIQDFSISFVDGFSKCLILQSIVAMIHHLDLWPNHLDSLCALKPYMHGNG